MKQSESNIRLNHYNIKQKTCDTYVKEVNGRLHRVGAEINPDPRRASALRVREPPVGKVKQSGANHCMKAFASAVATHDRLPICHHGSRAAAFIQFVQKATNTCWSGMSKRKRALKNTGPKARPNS